jgi:hypothetical protein
VRLPRFRVRTLTLAVAFVAVVLGAWRVWSRRTYCLERAKWHAVQEAGFRSESDGFRQEARDMRSAGDPAEAERLEAQDKEYRRESEHQARLSRDYAYLAAHPWLPLPSED